MDRALVCLRSLSPEMRAEVLDALEPVADATTEIVTENDEPAEEPRTFSVAEARALLGLPAA